jgi:hypothetical protein
MPTLEGITFIPIALFFFFKRPALLFPLLILSTVFQASSIVSSGSVGIQPYYCVATLFVIRFLVLRGEGGYGAMALYPFARFWVLFVVVSVASALILPFMFQGIPVFDPRIGIDFNFLLGPAPLRFQFGNIVQSGFLILNVLVVIAATRPGLSIERAHRMFFRSSYLIVLIVVVQDLFFWLGLPFPSKLLNNNPGYGVVPLSETNLRATGSFTEPSMAGAVLAGLVAAFLWQYFAGKTSILKPGVAVVALLLVASTSSLAAVIVVLVVLILANPVFRLPWFIRVARLGRISVFIIAAAVLTTLLIVPTFRSILLAQTLEKGGSDSALVRLGADLFALNLTLQTHGLGVGLGSNRPSSFVASLLSQVGVTGFVLFLFAALSTLYRLPKQHRWIGMAAVGLLLSMALGMPDLSFPFLWILLALAAQSKAVATIEATQLRTHRESRPCTCAVPASLGLLHKNT